MYTVYRNVRQGIHRVNYSESHYVRFVWEFRYTELPPHEWSGNAEKLAMKGVTHTCVVYTGVKDFVGLAIPLYGWLLAVRIPLPIKAEIGFLSKDRTDIGCVMLDMPNLRKNSICDRP
jgi:hypothetical protein